MITVYHNVRCSKSREVCGILKERKIDADIREYLKDPPSKAELSNLLKLLHMKASELIRKSEPVFKEQYAHKKMTEKDYLNAMVKHPILIERPIVVKDGRAIIGRPPERILELIA